jgi:predicted transcriptional regulator of viral defense system
MHIKNFKTLGPREAKLITALYENNKSIFRISDAAGVIGMKIRDANSAVNKLYSKGVVSRIKHGVYTIVPFELGPETIYSPDVYLTAREIMNGKDYYIAFASALQIHEMATQPQMTNYVAVKNMQRPVNAAGYDFKFIFLKKEYFFGIQDVWINKNEKVKVSSPEKTIIDCLHYSRYCGGITEAAKAMYIKKEILNKELLVEYGIRTGMGSVCSRLGFLMQLYNMADETELQKLKLQKKTSYITLDPVLPKAGRYIKEWMILQNVESEELTNVGKT